MYRSTIHASIIDQESLGDSPTDRSAPSWEKELQDVIVLEKQPGVELACICRGLAHPSAKWFHKGREVFSDFHMKLRQVGNTASLTIKNIREHDSGRFKCVMIGENGELDTTCVLSIKEPERIEPPGFVKELHDVEVEEGEKLELAVEARGTPPIGVFWYHNNVEITLDSPHFLLASLGQVHTLTLLHATAESSGEYVCEAYNDYGDTDTFCFVEVREVEHPEPPDFVTCPNTLTALEGESATFTCQVKGQPMPNVLWERGGVVIATSQKYKITKIQDQHSLTVYDTDQTDAGEYICHLHSPESGTSHVCSLHVVSNNNLEGLREEDPFQSRSVHVDGLRSTSRTDFRSFQKEEHMAAPQELSWRFNNLKVKNKEENIEDTTTAKSTYTASFKTTVGATPAPKGGSYNTLGTDYGSNRNQQQQWPPTDSLDAKSSIRQKSEAAHLVETPSLEESETRPNLPEAITTSNTKNFKKTDEKKSVINTNVTDFRSVLKSRDRTSQSHVAKSQNTDFRNVLSRDKVKQKEDNESYIPKESITSNDLANLSNVQTSTGIFSQSVNITSLPQSASPVLLNNYQNDSQSLKNLANREMKAGVNDYGLDSPLENRHDFEHLNSSTQSAVEVSLVEKRNWKTSRIIPANSWVPSHSFNKQELQFSALEKSGRENVRGDNTEVVKDINHLESARLSDMRAIRDSLDSSSLAQDKSMPGDTNSRETLFKSEIQILDTRKRGGREKVTSLTENEELTVLASLTTRQENNQIRYNDYSSGGDKLHLESRKEDSQQSYKASVIYFDPQKPSTTPTQKDFKLEVRSVLVSMPLQSSTSSSRSHSGSHSESISLPVRSSRDNADVKEEEVDNVFGDRTEEKASPDQNFSDHKQTLQSSGSSFTWQKPSGEETNAQESNSPALSPPPDTTLSSPPDTKINDITQIVNKRRSLSLLESKLDSNLYLESKGGTHTDSGISSLASNVSDSLLDFSSDDFRTSTLISAASRESSDWIRSKNPPATKDCFFADVKLKHVPKPDEILRKSRLSLTAERIKERPRGRDLADLFPKSKQDISQTNIKTTDSVSANKFLNSLDMPTNQSKYDKQIQDSKVRAVAEKYEKPSTPSVQHTNTNSRSKGLGARFEQSIKEATVSNRNTSPTAAKSNLERSSTKPPAGSDIYPRKVVDKIQQWQTAETVSTGNTGKKMLGVIGKSNSNNAILESGSRTHLDKIQDRLILKRHSLENNMDPVLHNTEKRSSQFVAVSKEDLMKSPLSLEKTRTNLQTSSLVKISDVVSQKKELFENSNIKNITVTESRNTKGDVLSDRNVKELEANNITADKFHVRNMETPESATGKIDISSQRNMTESEPVTMPTDSSLDTDVHFTTSEPPKRSKKPEAVQDEQNAQPEWVNRKSVNNIEAKIKANITGGNQQDKSKPEWLSVRPSTYSQQATSVRGDRSKAKSELDPVYRLTSKKDEQELLSSTNSSVNSSSGKLPGLNVTSSSLRQVESSHTSLLRGKSQASKLSDANTSHVFNADTILAQHKDIQMQTTTAIMSEVNSAPMTASSTVKASAKLISMYASEGSTTTMADKVVNRTTTQPDLTSDVPLAAKRGMITSKRSVDQPEPTPSVHVSKSWSKDLQGNTPSLPSTDTSPEPIDHQPHSLGDRPTWGKRKGHAYLPVGSALETELSLHHEVLGSSLDDSESVLSTASISSSSSDASNVTVDSGYPRSTTRSFVTNEKFGLSSRAQQGGNDGGYTSSSYSGKSEEKPLATDDFKTKKEKLVDSSVAKKSCEDDLRSGGADRQIQTSTRDQKNASVQAEGMGLKSETYIDPTIPVNAGYMEHSKVVQQFEPIQQTELMREGVKKTTDNSSKISNDSESVNEVKEGEEVADLSHDFGTTRKYSKKRRKNLEMQLNEGGSESTDINLISTSDPDILKSRFSRRFRENETETGTIRTTTGAVLKSREPSSRWNSKEPTTIFKSDEKQSESFSARKSRFEQNQVKITSVDNKHIALRPSELDLNPSWKTSRSHLKNTNDALPPRRNQEEKVIASTAEIETVTGVYSAKLSTVVPETQPQLSPPSFPLPLRDTVVMFGSRAVLKCRLLGNPRPDVKWLLNQKLLEPSKDIEILYTDECAQLTVRETYTDHVGDYACWAKNSLGTVSSHCTLSLEATNRTESRALEGRRFAPPKIVFLSPSAVSVPRRSPITLTATFLGEPTPAVKWMQGDRELISDNHVQIVTEGSTSCLTIQSANQSDAGKMSVCLTSCTGTDQASVNISIEDVPGPPVGRPHIYDIDSNSASLSWYRPASNEMSHPTHYIIEAKIQQGQSWEVIVPYCKDLSCHILGLSPCTVYQFRVLAANRYGLSLPSESSETVMTSDNFRSPSDYDSEAYADVFTPSFEFRTQDDFPFEPREVKINTQDKFEDAFELDKEVGKGKFGVVYKCKHRRDGTIWAAKIVKCREKDKGVIRREIDIMNKLRHPKLLLLWEAYESPRQMVLVMEYVGAGELFERVIGEDFVLTECDCVHFLRQICEGVNYMHNNNILHLDLKPENILCIAEDSNRIKIIDFGLAQFHEAGQSTKVLFGTPEFIAPEVINYDEIGFVTDMWSIGVICYVLLSGLSPFLGDNDAETLANVTSGEYDFDDEAFDEISDDAKHFMSQLLIMKKEKRMLTDQCMAHIWLNPKEVGGFRSRRLNTERLKRFMVRRKWLKTGNAVLAISRLLKSSNLSSLSAVTSANDSLTSPQSSSSSPTTPKQNNVAEIAQAVTRETEKSLAHSRGQNCENISQGVGKKVHNMEENVTNSGDCGDSETAAVSCVKNTASGQASAKTSENILDTGDSDVFRHREIKTGNSRGQSPQGSQTNHNTDQNDNRVTNNTLNILATCDADENKNVKQSASSVFSSGAGNKIDGLINRTASDQNILVVDDGINLQAPRFTKSMMNSTACVGDVARFDVVLAGDPVTSVSWYFEDEEVHSDSRHSLDSNQHTRTFSLVVRSIEVDDEGEYTCKAVNSQGESICVAELCVLEV